MLVGQILVEWQYFFCLYLVKILGAKFVVKIFSFRKPTLLKPLFEAPNQVYCVTFVADGLSYSQIDWNLGGDAHRGCI